LFVGPAQTAQSSSAILIGVVVAHNFGGLYDFQAVRIDALLDDDQAAKEIESATARPDQTEAVEIPAVDKLVCLIDRNDQEQEFIAAYRRTTSRVLERAESGQQHLASPLILLLPGAGEARHAPLRMVNRLSEYTVLERLSWSAAWRGAKHLRWPRPGVPPDEAVAALRDELWNQLAGIGTTPDNSDTYVKLWGDETRPRLFYSAATIDRPLNREMAYILSAWSLFWSRLVPHDRRVPIHLIFLSGTQQEVHNWLALGPRIARRRVVELPELDICSNHELETWLTTDLPDRLLPARHNGLLNKLVGGLRERYPGKFYLGEVALSVAQLIGAGFHV
jgi:hypothetical protein